MEARTSANLYCFFISPFVLCILLYTSKASIPDDVTRSHFPDGFVFGVATSAYQVLLYLYLSLSLSLLFVLQLHIYICCYLLDWRRNSWGWKGNQQLGCFCPRQRYCCRFLTISFSFFLIRAIYDFVLGNVENGDTGDIADDHYHRYLVGTWNFFKKKYFLPLCS